LGIILPVIQIHLQLKIAALKFNNRPAISSGNYETFFVCDSWKAGADGSRVFAARTHVVSLQTFSIEMLVTKTRVFRRNTSLKS
jgi:hypothetical protein